MEKWENEGEYHMIELTGKEFSETVSVVIMQHFVWET